MSLKERIVGAYAYTKEQVVKAWSYGKEQAVKAWNWLTQQAKTVEQSISNLVTEALKLTKYTIYMQDYGGPVGFRMALAYPDRVEALIVQDAVAHNEGLGANWQTRRAFWADRASHEAALRTNLLSLDTTRTRHVGNDPNPEKYDPDPCLPLRVGILWSDEYAFLNKPGEADIQSDLFYDYRTNVDAKDSAAPAGALGKVRLIV